MDHDIAAPSPPSTLHGRTAIVTGSTSGLGLGIATALAAAGCNVMLNGFGDADECERLRAELAATYDVRVAYCAADVSVHDDVAAMVARAAAELSDDAIGDGGVDILVNNAGIQHVAPIDSFPPARWAQVLAVNLTSNYHAIHACLPHMKRRGFGRIVNVASAHGLVASPYKSAYVAAKHGVVGLTKTVALEVAAEYDDITCNAVCPGFVATPLVEGQIESQMTATGWSRERVLHDVILASQPTKRLVSVDEVVAAAMYLVQPTSRSTTGTTLSVDGGWTAR